MWHSVLKSLYFALLETSLIIGGDILFRYRKKTQFSLHNWQNFSLRIMATLRNKRKLAAAREEHLKIRGTINRKTRLIQKLLKSTSPRFLKSLNGGSPKKLSKKFSRTESRISGALSKLDEILLNPQVWTCCVAFPRTSRNNDRKNWDSSGDRSFGDPVPMRCSLPITLVT